MNFAWVFPKIDQYQFQELQRERVNTYIIIFDLEMPVQAQRNMDKQRRFLYLILTPDGSSPSLYRRVIVMIHLTRLISEISGEKKSASILTKYFPNTKTKLKGILCEICDDSKKV